MPRLVLLLALLWGALAAAAPSAGAQAPPAAAIAAGRATASSDAKTPAEDAARLAAAIEDPEKRAELVRQLRLLAAAERGGPAGAQTPEGAFGQMVLDQIGAVADAVVRAMVDAGTLAANLPRFGDWLVDQVDDADSRARWLRILGELGTVFGLAAGIELIAWATLRHPRRALRRHRVRGTWRRLPYALLQAALELAPVLAFAAIALGALALLPADFAARFISLTVTKAIVAARIVTAVARAVLMPDAPGLRILLVGDETANYLAIWVWRFVAVAIYAFAVVDIAFLLGLPVSIHELLDRVLGLVVAGLAVVFVLQNRLAVSSWLRAEAQAEPATPVAVSALRGWLAEAWHILALAYIAVLTVVWAFRIPSGFAFVLRASAISLLIVLVAALALRAVRRILHRMFAVEPSVAREFPNIEARANRYMAIVGLVAAAAIGAVAVILVLQAWGVGSLGWLSSSFGQRLTGGAISIVVVGLLALFVWEVVDRVVERTLLRLARNGANGAGAASAVRLRTFLPLLRNVAMVVLATIFVLVALAELGVNTAPLLAGASIIGIAVAFGANALVKDVITGLFILLEGTINIGDVIEVDGRSGVVEGLSIRTLRLRDVTGAVHTVPFSNVASIKNMTRDFGYAVIDASVGYDSDLDQVTRVLADIDREMRADPAFAPLISAPIEIFGIEKFADSAIVVRARIRTPPGKHWAIGREFNRRMKTAFDREGILIPYPHQVVVDKRPPPPPPAPEAAAPRP
ncbi:MAG: mechanosensitive ion channel [Alphaproteobacteria bacterium]|nr:mechanosensitive ion channel [Alphaproteobacteria bacterium]